MSTSGISSPQHFLWQAEGSVATITINRPEQKNPLTLESYSELRDTFRDLVYADNIKTVVITGAGGNFCSGSGVHEIIGPLVEMSRKGDMAGLLAFTRMTGDLVKANAGLSAADRFGNRWYLRWSGRHSGDGVGSALRHAADQSCLLVRPHRAGWMRES